MQEEMNELDQYLKHKIEEADFSFKEDYWQKASQMLDDEDGNKRSPFFWRGLAIIAAMVVVGIGAIVYSNFGGKKDTRLSGKTAIRETAQPGETHTNGQEKSPGSMNTGTGSKATPPAAHVSGTDAPAGKSPNTAEQTEANTNTNRNLPIATTKEGENQQESQMVESNEKISPKTKNGKVRKYALANPFRKKAGREKLYAKNKPKTQKSEKAKMQTIPVANVNEDLSQKDNLPTINGRKMLPADTLVPYTKITRDESIYNPRFQAKLKNYVPEKIDTLVVLSYKPVLTTPNSIAESSAILKDSSAKKMNSMEFFLSLGANMNKGFKGNSASSATWGMTPYINAGFEKHLSQRISIATQIGFTTFNALNLEKKVYSYKYSFGYDSTAFSVVYKKLLQMHVPVSIYYQLSKEHSVWGAIGGSYTFNTSGKVRETDNSRASIRYGYTEGFNPFDLFLQFGYQFRLNSRIALQTSFQQGLLDATNNNYFGNSVRNSQTRISLGFRYNFKRNGN